MYAQGTRWYGKCDGRKAQDAVIARREGPLSADQRRASSHVEASNSGLRRRPVHTCTIAQLQRPASRQMTALTSASAHDCAHSCPGAQLLCFCAASLAIFDQPSTGCFRFTNVTRYWTCLHAPIYPNKQHLDSPSQHMHQHTLPLRTQP